MSKISQGFVYLGVLFNSHDLSSSGLLNKRLVTRLVPGIMLSLAVDARSRVGRWQ